jgi:hypothetical protein
MFATHPFRARLRAALAVLLVAAATAAVVFAGVLTSPAQAQAPACSSGLVTFFGRPNFGFPRGCATPLVNTCLGTATDRPARSAVNRTNRRLELYSGLVCTGRVGTLAPGQTRSSIPSTQSFIAR